MVSSISSRTILRVEPISAVNTSVKQEQNKSKENGKKSEKPVTGKTIGPHPKNSNQT